MAEIINIAYLGDPKFYYEARSIETLGPADIKITGAALHCDSGLETSVLISLFSDARADDFDILPQGFESRGGWWGTALEPRITFSKRWLLNRSKIDALVLKRCEQYDKDALQWAVDDGIFAAVNSVATRGGLYQVNSLVTMDRVQGDQISFKYFQNWENQMLSIGGL